MAADILQSLRKDILSGEFTSGEKLSEKSLSDRYGVSRTPVREALIHLAAEGLVSSEKNCGVRVIGRNAAAAHDVFVLRKAIDEMLVELACERLTEEEEAELTEIMNTMGFYVQKLEISRFNQVAMDFYRLICSICKNDFLRREAEKIYLYTAFFPNMIIEDEEYMLAAYEENLDVYEAILERNAKKAREAVGRRLDAVIERKGF